MRGARGVARKRGVMGRGPQFFPLPDKQTLPTSLAQLPPPTTTHPCPQGLSKRGHAGLGGDGLPTWGVKGTGPSGMQMWDGCPRWGGHPGTSAPPWQKEGEASTPPAPPL